MPTLNLNRSKRIPSRAISVAAKPENQRLIAALISRPPVTTKRTLPVQPRIPQRQELPGRYLTIERQPFAAYDDNPVFNEFGAAEFIGVSAETIKKWRQRDMGPDYLQYGASGPVRYELSALREFRAVHRIKTGRKR